MPDNQVLLPVYQSEGLPLYQVNHTYCAMVASWGRDPESHMVATIKRFLGIILLAWMAIPGVYADQPSPSPSNRPVNLCYCRCNTSHSKQACTKMCELPKYESRWWASSCHKRTPPPAKKSPESRPHPPKHSGVETARR